MEQRIKGQVIIELLIAFALASILLPALLTGLIAARNGKIQQEQRLVAVGLLKEGEEAVRSMRDVDWANIATPGTYYPKISGSSWVWGIASDGVIGDFTRTIEIKNLIPDDPSEKEIVVSVTWSNLFSTTVSSTFRLSRWKNQSHSPMVASGMLTQGGFGNWCNPTELLTTVDLSRQGVPTAVWARESSNQTGNRVFAGTGVNASGKPLTNTKITGNSPSITAIPVADFNKGGTKANGVYADESYAYLATDKSAEAMIILDLNQFTDPPTNSSYLSVGAFNSKDQKDANSVYAVGNTAYLTTQTLYTINTTDKTSPTKIGSISLDGAGKKVIVNGNYAYIAISGSSTKLQIVDISNPGSPASTGKYINLTLADARDIFVDSTGNTVYLVTGNSSTQSEFFIIDATNKSSPSVVSGKTYDVGGMDPQGVTVVSNNTKAIIVGKNGSVQYIVLDLTLSPLGTCGAGLAISGGANAVSSVFQTDQHAYSYIVTGDSHAELKIIEGGAGGGGDGGGTFESPIFDAGKTVVFNNFTETDKQPPSITATYEVAVSTDGTTFNYVPSTGIIPISINPGRYFRYRVTFSGGGVSNTTASVTVRVNYSP